MFVGVVIDIGVLLCYIVLCYAILYGRDNEEGEGSVYTVNIKVSRIYIFTEAKLSIVVPATPGEDKDKEGKHQT